MRYWLGWIEVWFRVVLSNDFSGVGINELIYIAFYCFLLVIVIRVNKLFV